MNAELEQWIEDDIVFGFYPPGSRLIEDRLIERYSASRHAVRAALVALENRHLIVRLPNRGAQVIEMTPEEVEEIYEARMVLETAAAARTPLPLEPSHIAALEDLCRRHAAAYEAGDPQAVFSLNLEFHRLHYGLCGNATLAQMIEDTSRRVQSIRAVKYDDDAHMRIVIEQHWAIIEALRNSDRTAYVQAVSAHLPASAEEYRKVYDRRHRHNARLA
ncbi:GntR family transcriptional regulator [Paracoccus sp. MKU1]|uniref:GntR family transcriptional regulator n=1 Tax=Paracoccus sp. MKU1 TaxID=1745182 RepID=UPI00071933E1|nr:GntR family transcriptional regulator [Paracoccus sp. MKU1]KRW96018.1 hypothetical protein AQY21_11495 [Paracoccus sp. MKU1]